MKDYPGLLGCIIHAITDVLIGEILRELTKRKISTQFPQQELGLGDPDARQGTQQPSGSWKRQGQILPQGLQREYGSLTP